MFQVSLHVWSPASESASSVHFLILLRVSSSLAPCTQSRTGFSNLLYAELSSLLRLYESEVASWSLLVHHSGMYACKYRGLPLWRCTWYRAFQLGLGEGPIGLVGPISQPRGIIDTASRNHSQQWVLLGDEFCDLTFLLKRDHRFNCKRPGMVPGYLFMVSHLNINAPEHSWLHDSQRCVASRVCLCGWHNRTPLRDLSTRPC